MDTPSTHPYDWNAKLVRFFLGNARLVWLLIIGLVIGGTFSLLGLRRESFPVVTPKVVLVQTIFPGSSAPEVERQVTEVIENAVKDVKGRKQTSSTSANSFSNVVVTLDESANLDTAIQDVQSKIQSAQANLPSDTETPKVLTFATSGPAFTFGITNGTSDLNSIRRDADIVALVLSKVNGIKSAQVADATDQRVTIRFRLADLTAKGVAIQSLQLTLQGANVNFPVGQLDISKKSQSLLTVGSFNNLDDIKQLVVGVDPKTFKPVMLLEVAEVVKGYGDSNAINRFGYHRDRELVSVPGVLLNVETTSTADVIRTHEELMRHLQVARDDGTISSTVQVITLNDQAKATGEQISEILNAAIGERANYWLLGGLQLLFIALLIFVNWRAAVVTTLSIPLSFLFTFLFLAINGIQLNTIVLFSMILVLGLIVDPAIVMVEAIQRFRDMKYPPNEAVLESGRRYGASLFLAVLTSIIVFIPFGVVSGIFGEIIKYIPLTVIPALAASYFVPIALLPLISKYFLKAHADTHFQDGKNHEVEGLSTAAEWFMRFNRKILSRNIWKITTLFASFILVGLSISLISSGKIQTVQFAKPQDAIAISVDVTFTRGMTLFQRDLSTQWLEKKLLTERRIESYAFYSQSPNGLFIFINLFPKKDYPSTENASKKIVTRLKTEISNIANITDAIIKEQSQGTPEPDYQISTELSADNQDILQAAGRDVGRFLASQPKVVKVDDGFTGRGEPELQIVLNRVKIAQAGLSSYEIGQQVQAIVSETKVTKFTGVGGPADIYLVNDIKPNDAAGIRKLPLLGRTGQPLTVGDVAEVRAVTSVDTISRLNGSRFITIQARVDGNNTDVAKVQSALNAYLNDTKLRDLKIIKTTNAGELDAIAKSFRELGIALVIAVVLTYLALVLQFKSFSQPLVMVVTVPLSFIGVFPVLWAAGLDLGFLELLGVTILVGIVENVAIFLIDYANQLVNEQGLTPTEAIIRATGVRFRPIILTKLVALGGLLPLAIESEFWRGLALVIIAGIGISGFLSLIVIPILYTWIEGGRTKFHRRFKVSLHLGN